LSAGEKEGRASVAGFLLGIVVMLPALVLACVKLTDEQKATIARDQIEMNVCAAEAHDAKESDAGAAKAWAVFDDCMTRKGFYDGGRDAR
jgi:hypothetical protein